MPTPPANVYEVHNLSKKRIRLYRPLVAGEAEPPRAPSETFAWVEADSVEIDGNDGSQIGKKGHPERPPWLKGHVYLCSFEGKSKGFVRVTDATFVRRAPLTTRIGLAIGTFLKVLGEVRFLPDPEPGVFLLVTERIAEHLPDRQDLVVPSGQLTSANGRLAGYLGLQRAIAHGEGVARGFVAVREPEPDE